MLAAIESELVDCSHYLDCRSHMQEAEGAEGQQLPGSKIWIPCLSQDHLELERSGCWVDQEGGEGDHGNPRNYPDLHPSSLSHDTVLPAMDPLGSDQTCPRGHQDRAFENIMLHCPVKEVEQA